VKPTLSAVLAEIVLGRVARLDLTRDQKQTLSDRDGQLALNVVRHLIPARGAAVQPNDAPVSFPLTEHAFTALEHKLGTPVGQKRARQLIRRLAAVHVIEQTSSYRQPDTGRVISGYRVALYKLGRAIGAPSARCAFRFATT
jgi:hypothetical protein